jgi:hypothetical protein
VALGAVPVVVANVIVAAAALYSPVRPRSGWKYEWSTRISRRANRSETARVG